MLEDATILNENERLSTDEFIRQKYKQEGKAKTMNTAKRMIWVTFRKEGIHKYPQALTDPNLEEVKFLGYPHRHMFHFKVEIEVFHDDRELEFILFKRELEALYAEEGAMTLNFQSCEMIARELAKYIQTKYPNRALSISVAEDNENGCRLVWD